MKLICKLGGSIYGYVDTNNESITLDKGKEYFIEKVSDPKYGTYYNVYDDEKLIATLSESEVNLFFKD